MGRPPLPRSTNYPPKVQGASWIALTQGKFALVDDTDLGLVDSYSWAFSQRYPITSINGKLVRMHTVIMGTKMVDHINGDGLDNRRVNLRSCTKQGNAANTGVCKTNTSGFKGVAFDKNRNKWIAYIVVDGKRKGLGRFTTKEEAAQAYDDAAKKAFGEFAKTNLKESAI